MTWYFSDPPMEIIRDDNVIHDLQIALEAKNTQQDIDLPEDQQVQPHSSSDHTVLDGCGIHYQKCGGGRRVIRKRIGGN